MLSTHWALPSDFSNSIVDSLPIEQEPGPPVGLRKLLTPAKISLAAGLVFMAGLVVGITGLSPGDTELEKVPGDPRPSDTREIALSSPNRRAFVGVHSAAEYTVTWAGGEFKVTESATLDEKLPATIKAGASTHLVLSVGGGSVVFAPGASGRVSDSDRDGVADFEPLEGKFFVESQGRGARVRAAFGDIIVGVSGGAAVLPTRDTYIIAATHGSSQVLGLEARDSIRRGLCAVVEPDGTFSVVEHRPGEMEDWEVNGRLETFSARLAGALGDKLGGIPRPRWAGLLGVARAMLADPYNHYRDAEWLRLVLRYAGPDQLSPQDRAAIDLAATFLAEDSTEQDLPGEARLFLDGIEEEFREDRSRLDEWIKRLDDPAVPGR
ncbi:MAG: hypothetical protein OEY28_12185 [Nitrospira sp.]|nr:hypothetical protein [Nitrospira sp.]